MPPRYLDRPAANEQDANTALALPYGVTATAIVEAVNDVYTYLHALNNASVGQGYGRLEELIPPLASFSGFFSNIFAQAMARCTANAQPGLAVNQWPNGRPTLVPRGLYAGDAVQHGGQGIEVKASRSVGSYQGHNIAAGWLMVLHYALDDTTEPVYERNPMRVVSVMFAKFQVTDWGLGQEATSQRPTTVSVRGSGLEKLNAGVVYAPSESANADGPGRLSDPAIPGAKSIGSSGSPVGSPESPELNSGESPTPAERMPPRAKSAKATLGPQRRRATKKTDSR